MDWFEKLTGFRETSYDDTRAKLKVEGIQLQSLINGKSYGIGELELVPLQVLRERVKSGRYPAWQTVHRDTPRRGSHRCRRGRSAAGLAGLLLGPPGGLHAYSASSLGTVRVADSVGSVRSHDVSRCTERTTRRIERRSAHAAWRERLWQ